MNCEQILRNTWVIEFDIFRLYHIRFLIFKYLEFLQDAGDRFLVFKNHLFLIGGILIFKNSDFLIIFYYTNIVFKH